ncbi:MAG: HIT domain-containing protein [Candidatus ainarchaeum sp.]|nr:HIT domain-containing protein [Candidatus ainarchaeum sp.]
MNPILAKRRYEYYTVKSSEQKCPFCNPDKNVIIFESKNSYIISNRFPYIYGHLLVTPKRHVEELEDLSKDELNEILENVLFSKKILNAELKPIGYNIGINLGDGSGRSKKHLHWHIVPRYQGDIGFLTTLAETQVFSKDPIEMTKDLKKKTEELQKE